MFYGHLKGHVEALLFAAGDPLAAKDIARVLEIEECHAAALLAELREEMQAENRGLTVVEVAGGYQLCTKPELAEVIAKLEPPQETRLSAAALETLAIIAFRQPVTRQEIEDIRGVKADSALNTLLERGLIRELGRKEGIGRPILYGTTPEFLQCLGINSLSDLPPLPDPQQE